MALRAKPSHSCCCKPANRYPPPPPPHTHTLPPPRHRAALAGLALFCVVPTTLGVGVSLVRSCRGNEALALLLTVGTNVVAIFLMPLWLKALYSGQSELNLSVVRGAVPAAEARCCCFCRPPSLGLLLLLLAAPLYNLKCATVALYGAGMGGQGRPACLAPRAGRGGDACEAAHHRARPGRPRQGGPSKLPKARTASTERGEREIKQAALSVAQGAGAGVACVCGLDPV